MAKKVAFVSLGCSKNLVDSERMAFILREAGYELVGDVNAADVAVVNTCGFIDTAKAEAIENILALGGLKKKKGSRLKTLLVAGCLAELEGKAIMAEMPEVDGVVGCSATGEVLKALEAAEHGARPVVLGAKDAYPGECGRVLSTRPESAYVKIGEGCDNRCAYCLIPTIRGPARSRKEEDILAECQSLCAAGVKELIIVAQDITKYGVDLYGQSRLVPLLKRLCELDVEWIRLHYANPDGVTDELLELVKTEQKIVKYLDIPIQHVNDGILKAMNRRYTKADIIRLFDKIRREIPGAVVRTSLIVGFPGEGEAEFEELCGFLRAYRLEKVGVFTFSPQEGTPAVGLDNRPEPEAAVRRAELISHIQENVTERVNAALIGKTVKVLVEGYDGGAGMWYGRSYAESPDVDGKIWLRAGKNAPISGKFVRVRIESAEDGEPAGIWEQGA